jgi:tetratricopeptide (TPR) repeat protein
MPADSAKIFLEEATIKYQNAILVNPGYAEAYHGCGLALFEWADRTLDDSTEILLDSSFEMYERATELKPRFWGAYLNWGRGQHEYTRLLSDDDQASMFVKCFENYDRALFIKPDVKVIFENWAAALRDYGNLVLSSRADAMFDSRIIDFVSRELNKNEPCAWYLELSGIIESLSIQNRTLNVFVDRLREHAEDMECESVS